MFVRYTGYSIPPEHAKVSCMHDLRRVQKKAKGLQCDAADQNRIDVKQSNAKTENGIVVIGRCAIFRSVVVWFYFLTMVASLDDRNPSTIQNAPRRDKF